jgi:hypothetical protein
LPRTARAQLDDGFRACLLKISMSGAQLQANPPGCSFQLLVGVGSVGGEKGGSLRGSSGSCHSSHQAGHQAGGQQAEVDYDVTRWILPDPGALDVQEPAVVPLKSIRVACGGGDGDGGGGAGAGWQQGGPRPQQPFSMQLFAEESGAKHAVGT